MGLELFNSITERKIMKEKITWDSPFIKGLGKITDLITLSIIYCISCLPIVTIGTATTALYYSIVKSVRKGRSTPLKEYFYAFKKNFVQGLIVGTIQIIAQGLLVYNILITANMNLKSINSDLSTSLFTKIQGNFLIYFYLFFLVLSFFISLYLYPFLSRYDFKISNLFFVSTYCVFKHLLTSITVAILSISALLAIFYSFLTLAIIMPALATLIISIAMEKVLRQYMPENQEQNADEWYLE